MMKFPGPLITSLVMLCIVMPAIALEQPVEQGRAGHSAALELDGKSFQGRIRSKGLFGLFRVKGTLAFKDGHLVWSVKGAEDSAPYEAEATDGGLRFTSHVPAEDGTYVDWSGTFDGESVTDVTAIWTRIDEKDFIHDLFLPDVVTLVFKQSKK